MKNETPVLPSEEYEEQLLNFAFQELLAQQYEELNAQPLTPEEEELLKMAEKNRDKHLKLIDRTLTRQQRSAQLHPIVITVMKYAAVLVLLANLSFGTALAVSPELRSEVIEFLNYITAPFVRVGTEEDQSSSHAPQGWLGDYFPTYLPEGYEMFKSIISSGYSSVIYKDGNLQSITLSTYQHPHEIQANAENALCYTATVKGVTAYLYIMTNQSMITWETNNTYYMFIAPAANILLDIVESLVPNENCDSSCRAEFINDWRII